MPSAVRSSVLPAPSPPSRPQPGRLEPASSRRGSAALLALSLAACAGTRHRRRAPACASADEQLLGGRPRLRRRERAHRPRRRPAPMLAPDVVMRVPADSRMGATAHSRSSAPTPPPRAPAPGSAGPRSGRRLRRRAPGVHPRVHGRLARRGRSPRPESAPPTRSRGLRAGARGLRPGPRVRPGAGRRPRRAHAPDKPVPPTGGLPPRNRPRYRRAWSRPAGGHAFSRDARQGSAAGSIRRCGSADAIEHGGAGESAARRRARLDRRHRGRGRAPRPAARSVSWATRPRRGDVASSGDLSVTIGTIVVDRRTPRANAVVSVLHGLAPGGTG